MYEYNKKLLITLLHIPTEYSDLMKKTHTNLDDDIVKASRDRFKKSFSDKHIEELDEEWYDRIKFPLAMNDEGIFFKKT